MRYWQDSENILHVCQIVKPTRYLRLAVGSGGVSEAPSPASKAGKLAQAASSSHKVTMTQYQRFRFICSLGPQATIAKFERHITFPTLPYRSPSTSPSAAPSVNQRASCWRSRWRGLRRGCWAPTTPPWTSRSPWSRTRAGASCPRGPSLRESSL